MAPKARPLRERILRSIAVDDSGCWRWQLAVDKEGYGRISVPRNGHSDPVLAHRIAYIEWRGSHDAGLELDHLCRVRSCVNPDHLEPVTHQENMRRMSESRRTNGRTHCANGHELTAENIRLDRGHRACKECNRIAARKWRAANRSRKGDIQ